MAGKPLDALALIALGCRSLSMASSGIGPVRATIRSAKLSDIEPFVVNLITTDTSSLRERLRSFALDRGIVVG